jgi:hypothetical protein
MCDQSCNITTSSFIFHPFVLKSTLKRVSSLKYVRSIEHATYVHVDLLSFSYTPSNNGNNQTLFHSSSHSWHMQGNYTDSSYNGVNMEFRALPQKVIYVIKLHNGCLHSVCVCYFRSHCTPLTESRK